jgi:signal transduction histidine kinase
VTADRLVSGAQRRLAITTLVLLVGLVVAIGATTAIVAQQSLDASVDRTLDSAAIAELARLHEATGSEATGAAQPAESESASENEGESTAPAKRAPAPLTAAPGSPGAPPPASTDVAADPDDHAPAAADTFFLYLDTGGAVVANPERVALPGLPDRGAARAAMSTGRDMRTISVGQVRVRLLTLAVPPEDSGTSSIRTLQSGFVLTLHDEQTNTLLGSILIVGLASLAGAALVSVAVTRRALVPVRAGFERERRFVASASHELRTPIALIRSSAEVLGREGKVRPDGRQLVADIVSEADRLGGLVADLSELAVAQARPAGGLVPVDLALLARDVVSRARPMAQMRGVRLEASDGGPLAVRADRDRIVQVGLILIDNAIRHSPAGGTVRVAVGRADGFVELSVSDAGPGVPAVDRERIFEPFARLAESPAGSSARGGGSGLGLAIARSIVTGMGGQIGVEDAPGGGARFVIWLPGA